MSDAILENREKARRGLFQVLILRAVFALGGFAAIAVYARLLDAKQFGLMAMATSAVMLAGLLRDFGWAASAIQRETLSNEERDELFWLSFASNVVSVIALLATAPLVAHFFNEPTLVAVIAASSFFFFVWGLQGQHSAQLRRHMRFNDVLRAEAGGIVAGIVVGVPLAYLWRDVWALVASNVAQCCVTASLVFLANPWVPKRPTRFQTLARSLTWGRDYLTQNTLTYLSNNWGQIVVGNQLGAVDLGFYNRALQLLQFPQGMLLGPLSEVFSPLLSRAQHDADETRKLYLGFLSSSAIIFFPLAAVLPAISRDLVLFILGPNWADSAWLLACLSPALAALGVTIAGQVMLTTQGRVDRLRNWSLADFILRAGGATAGLWFGATGVAAIPSILSLLVGAPAMVLVVGWSTRVTAREQFSCLVAPVLMALACAGAASAAHHTLLPVAVPVFIRLVVESAAGLGAAAIVGLVLPQSRRVIFGSAQMLIRRKS
ncbi:lipopolysaccharide biosynthesis protein [Alsobacter sp. R-9]